MKITLLLKILWTQFYKLIYETALADFKNQE